ncbi:virion structural protein [Pseudomonas phage 201phi2-1]|uniref:Uncharacterized protein n=1 Tax=Pseudomonas phage 201phi2-1 TaxID=198110 RepID=B3FJJ8_BP201|nr:virion structural protein [Pseudomonas phage 201phi2-1]ABY63163.1 hypothetical protein 201phi2-1p338 [Pseudomonas phage 201phi2-1]
MKSSTRITIPIIHGVNGCIMDFPFTRQGETRLAPIKWITPIEVEYPDGWAIFKLKTVPTLILYEDHKEFEIWDQYMMSKPKLVGRVKINCTTDYYEVELEPKYRCFRLSMILLVHHNPQEPFYTNAFRNRTPYGEWRYKDVI